MRNRKIRILHEGNEYYLVDRGRTRASRVITFLKRLEGDAERAADGAVLVKTDVGDCVTIASWTQGELTIDRGRKDLKKALTEILERYLEEFRVGRKRRNAPSTDPTYYFLSVDKLPLYALSNAHPTGLSALVFTSEEQARKAAEQRRGIEARPIAIEPIGDLFDFLSARATEGFAGATVDEVDPIFFCLDEAGAPSFLRLSLDKQSGRLEHHLLDAEGTWSPYEGEEELTPEFDQDILDQQMTDRLGDIPFLGFVERMTFYRPVADDDPEHLVAVPLDPEDGDERVISPLFHDEEAAREFIGEHLTDDHELVETEDIPALCRLAERQGLVVQLHPGSHRARGGTFWMHGEELILDSFSGLWTSTDGADFGKSPSGDHGSAG